MAANNTSPSGVQLGEVYPFTKMEIVRLRSDIEDVYVRNCEDYLIDFGYQTARAYANDLTAWWDWCVEHDQRNCALNPERAMIITYLDGMLADGYSPNTVARRLTALRGFFDHAVGALRNPARAVPRIARRR